MENMVDVVIINRLNYYLIKSLSLSNPKTFLPLLLFIGFVFVLIGIGFWTFTKNMGFVAFGILLIFLSIILYVFFKD